MAIAVVDLSREDGELVALLHQACSEEGFFYVVGHGIPECMLQSVMEASKCFFELPMATKTSLNAKNSPSFRGYTPFCEEKLDPDNQLVGDTKEGFYLGSEPKEGQEHTPFQGTNQWPAEDVLPGWRNLMERYMEALVALSLRLVRLIGKAIALCSPEGQEYDFSPHFTHPLTFLRLLHYNSTISQPSDGVFGCGAHSDYGMLTLLLTDNVPALQIFPRQGGNNLIPAVTDSGWQTVEPRTDGFIVNLGDMLQRWSNDRYQSTLHRVVNLTEQERYSIPFFFEPNFDTLVECLPSCTTADCPALYQPISSGQYLVNKYKSTHSDFHEAASPVQ